MTYLLKWNFFVLGMFLSFRCFLVAISDHTLVVPQSTFGRNYPSEAISWKPKLYTSSFVSFRLLSQRVSVTSETTNLIALASIKRSLESCRPGIRNEIFQESYYKNKKWISHQTQQCKRCSIILPSKRKNDDNEDTENTEDNYIPKLGMEKAFEELQKLTSLDNDEEESSIQELDPNSLSTVPSNSGIDPLTMMMIADDNTDTTIRMKVVQETPNVPLEKEIETYKSMVEEIEANEVAEAYNEMVSNLGGKTKTVLDVYSDVILGLGGTPQPPVMNTFPPTTTNETTTTTTTATTIRTTNDEFLNAALQEALKDVSIQNPKVSNSIMDDKELMKEIEQIWNQGNEVLMASLEDIRKEQEELTRLASTQRMFQSSPEMDAINEDQKIRLADAEQSMSNLLQQVTVETTNVQKALDDLNIANEQMNDNALMKLKQGGLVKQGVAVGFLLFAVRSILDTINAVTNNDESFLVFGLVQGAIAILFAILYRLI